MHHGRMSSLAEHPRRVVISHNRMDGIASSYLNGTGNFHKHRRLNDLDDRHGNVQQISASWNSETRLHRVKCAALEYAVFTKCCRPSINRLRPPVLCSPRTAPTTSTTLLCAVGLALGSTECRRVHRAMPRDSTSMPSMSCHRRPVHSGNILPAAQAEEGAGRGGKALRICLHKVMTDWAMQQTQSFERR